MLAGGTLAAARPFLAVVPAVILVLLVMLLVIVAFPFGQSSRQYGLDVMDRGIDLAAVLMGKPRARPTASRRLPQGEQQSS